MITLQSSSGLVAIMPPEEPMPHKDEACHHEWIVTDDYDLHGCAKCGVVGGPVTRSALKAQIAKLRGITEQQEREIVRLMALVKELTDAARRESR